LNLHCQTKGWLSIIEKSINNVDEFLLKFKNHKRTLNKDIMQIKLIKYKNPIIKFLMYIYLTLFL
jgi:hypothetical protein